MEYIPQLLQKFSVGLPKSWWTNNIWKEGKLNNYFLCYFGGELEIQYKGIADYVKTFQTKTDVEISYYINFLSFCKKEIDEFDLLVYAVQINKEVKKIENKYDDNHI